MRKHTRRRVLGLTAAGLSGAALAGCGVFDDAVTPASAPVAADALLPLLAETVALAAQYDRAAVTQPGLAGRLTPLADDHRAHATALAQLIGKAVPPMAASPMASSPPASSPPASSLPASSPIAEAGTTAGATDVVAHLRTAEQIAQRNAVAACATAPAERTALVGSIAACRATHVEALR